MLAMLLLAQVASQPITIRDPISPDVETRLRANCGEEGFELRWTVLEGQDSRFDAVLKNGRRLPRSEIDALNRWKGGRSIERISVRSCEGTGRQFRAYLIVEFGQIEGLGLPRIQRFEIVDSRLIFEPPVPRELPARNPRGGR